MFTGIVEEIGRVERVKRAGVWQLTLRAQTIVEDLHVGDSVSVNGICLTVTSVNDSTFGVDVTTETLKRTDLVDLRPGTAVNLERPVRSQDRLGGHLVSGHIDGVGTIVGRMKRQGAEIVTVRAPRNILRYLVPQGSVAVDGVSLTVLETLSNGFTFSLIPHTAQVTILGNKGTGAKVNIEVDIVGKYIEKFLAGRAARLEGK